ncbi:hypothetical protein COBT_004212, partial [Conglomerata obtusa]
IHSLTDIIKTLLHYQDRLKYQDIPFIFDANLDATIFNLLELTDEIFKLIQLKISFCYNFTDTFYPYVYCFIKKTNANFLINHDIYEYNLNKIEKNIQIQEKT